MADHPDHVWHQRVDGEVRCALQGCDAEPTALEATEATHELEVAASMRIELEYRR